MARKKKYQLDAARLAEVLPLIPAQEDLLHRKAHRSDDDGAEDRREDPVGQIHLRAREPERASLPENPVKMALVRALHREGVALLALAQRSFAKLDSSDLVHQPNDREGAEQHQNQRARRNAVGLVAPALEGVAFLPCDCDHQWKFRHMGHPHEPRLLIDGTQHEAGWRGGRLRGGEILGQGRQTSRAGGVVQVLLASAAG